MEKLSIAAIIPLFNGAQWIENCLASVLAQTHAPSEIIVVDDGSTDSGPQIVLRLASQHDGIRLLRKANGGQSSARNSGVRASSSKLIAFLDQDDLWYPRHLEELIGPFRQNPALGWCYSDLDAIDEDGTISQRMVLRHRKMSGPKTSVADCVARDMFVLPSAALISRDAFEKVQGFDEHLSGYEDDDLFLRIFVANYSNIFLDKPLSQWRFHAKRSSHTARMNTSRLLYFQKLLAEYPALSYAYGQRFAMAFLAELVRAIRTGDQKRIKDSVLGAELAIPHVPSPKRAILHAALYSLQTSPQLAAIFFRLPPVRAIRMLFRP